MEVPHPNSPTGRPKSWRHRVIVSAILARELPEIQETIDRFIVAHYRPKAERDEGTLCRLIFNTLLPITPWKRKVGEGSPMPKKREVFFPPLLVEKIEE